nr:putative ribonuclease H protein [Ipomoea batatas]
MHLASSYDPSGRLLLLVERNTAHRQDSPPRHSEIPWLLRTGNNDGRKRVVRLLRRRSALLCVGKTEGDGSIAELLCQPWELHCIAAETRNAGVTVVEVAGRTEKEGGRTRTAVALRHYQTEGSPPIATSAEEDGSYVHCRSWSRPHATVVEREGEAKRRSIVVALLCWCRSTPGTRTTTPLLKLFTAVILPDSRTIAAGGLHRDTHLWLPELHPAADVASSYDPSGRLLLLVERNTAHRQDSPPRHSEIPWLLRTGNNDGRKRVVGLLRRRSALLCVGKTEGDGSIAELLCQPWELHCIAAETRNAGVTVVEVAGRTEKEGGRTRAAVALRHYRTEGSPPIATSAEEDGSYVHCRSWSRPHATVVEREGEAKRRSIVVALLCWCRSTPGTRTTTPLLKLFTAVILPDSKTIAAGGLHRDTHLWLPELHPAADVDGPDSRNRRHRPDLLPLALCLSPGVGRESDARLCRDPSLVAITEKGDQEDGEDRASPVEVTPHAGWLRPVVSTNVVASLLREESDAGNRGEMGFCEVWIDLVYRAISNIWYSVIINGVKEGFFTSSRGLRQGDPLSPSLFTIAAEVLSMFLARIHSEENIPRFSQPAGTPHIHHLAYADDVIIFSTGNQMAISRIIRALKEYEDISDHMTFSFHISRVPYLCGKEEVCLFLIHCGQS